MKITIQNILAIDSELEVHYREILKKYDLDKMDSLVMDYEKELSASKGQLGNDRIKYFVSMFAYYAYVLNATLSRHGIRSDVAELYLESQSAIAYLKEPEPDRKYTREERQSMAKIDTTNEAKASILYSRVTQAIETRIKAFNKLIETLNMLGTMNMSEARLGGRQ